VTSPAPHDQPSTAPLSLAEEQRRADEADRLRRARERRRGFPLTYLFRN